MPSPVGHALAGLLVHVLSARGPEDLRDRTRLGVALGAALAPDVDLLFRFVDGRSHHNHETHSIGFALGAGLAVAAFAWMVRGRAPMALGVLAGAAWLSHVVLDYLNADTSIPIGIMALWPLSDGFYKIPFPLFLDIRRTLSWASVRHDALAAAWEAAVLAPLLFGAWRLRHYFERH
jgi:membrane-bound metal-dependent hydrolase YbcI (DUF457 family)